MVPDMIQWTSGAFWIQRTNDSLRITTNKYLSSMRGKLLAIYGALITVLSDSNVKLYSDSQSAIDSTHNILGLGSRDIRLIHKQKNLDILLNIRYLISSKNINIVFIKVKGHSGNSGNNLVDDIAKTTLARNLEHFRLTYFPLTNSFISIHAM